MQVEELFPSPLLTFENLITEDLNNEIIEHLMVLKKLNSKEENNSWHSDNSIFEHPAYCIQSLRKKIEDSYLKMANFWFDKISQHENPKETQDKIKTTQRRDMWGWAVFQTEGDYVPPHVHPGSNFSAIYFCQIPELKAPNGFLEFINPVPGAMQGIPFRHMEKKLVKPKERSLLLFPSYLGHWVHPLQGKLDKPRISLGVDIRITTDYINRGY